MAIEIVVGIGVAALLLGLLIGYFIPSGGAKKARVTELENALESAQEELADYKREVFGQFAETAEKFRALDQSYHDLHRQLAASSVALCGDAATPLLAGPMLAPETEALIGEAFETDARQDDAQQDTDAQETAEQVEASQTTSAGETELKKSQTQQSGTQPELPGDVQAQPALSKEASGEDEIVVSEAGLAGEVADEADIVPTLTDVDAEGAKLASAELGQEKKPAEGDVDVDREDKRASA